MSSEPGIWENYGAMILTAGGSALLALGVLAIRSTNAADAEIANSAGLLAPARQVFEPAIPADQVSRADTPSGMLLPEMRIAPAPTARVLKLAAALPDDHAPEPATRVVPAPAPHKAEALHHAHDHAAEAHAAQPETVQLAALTATAPAPQNAAPPKPPACITHLKALANRTTVYFSTGSGLVESRGRAAAYVLASMAQDCPEAKVTIIGFADPSGDRDLNLALSWLRSNNVLQAITAAGFDASRFRTMSHMQGHPEEGCEHYDVVDRRVEFSITWDKPKELAQN